MKGQNWPLSDTENIVKISRYFLNIAISRYFQMMQYIAFAIYRDTKRSPLVLTLAVFSPLWKVQNQGWAFYIAIYRECNILHHLEISRYYDIQKISRYFNDIFLCVILINFGLLWTWKQLQIIFLVVLLYKWASISKFLLLYLICILFAIISVMN